MNYATVADAVERRASWTEVAQLCLPVLTEVAEGGRPLQGVVHPLGFICLPVLRGGDEGVCVHTWDESLTPAESTTSTIHCHSWDLVSYVLYGQVSNVLLKVRDVAEAGTHRVFEIHSRDGVDEIEATRRMVDYAVDRRELVGAGQTYRLDAGHFHQTLVVGGEAATLALGLTRPATDLSLGPPDMPSHRLQRRQLNTEQTRATAQRVMSILARHGASPESGGT